MRFTQSAPKQPRKQRGRSWRQVKCALQNRPTDEVSRHAWVLQFCCGVHACALDE